MTCKRSLAYRDVGKGREQDAEALRPTCKSSLADDCSLKVKQVARKHALTED
jgi:hypothetical protein